MTQFDQHNKTLATEVTHRNLVVIYRPFSSAVYLERAVKTRNLDSHIHVLALPQLDFASRTTVKMTGCYDSCFVMRMSYSIGTQQVCCQC